MRKNIKISHPFLPIKDPNRHLHLQLSAIKDSTEVYKKELTSAIDDHIE